MKAENPIIDGCWRILYVEETGSTNLDLADGVRSGKLNSPDKSSNELGLVLIADYQTAGRGRMGRSWEVARGDSALLVSVLIWPQFLFGGGDGATNPNQQLLHLTNVAMSLALIEACEKLTGKSPKIKWPNDLVIEDGGVTKKLSGMLTEIVGEALIIGVGVNLDTPKLGESKTHPNPPPLVPLGLRDLVEPRIERDILLKEILAGFEARYSKLGKADFVSPGMVAELNREVVQHSALLGKRVEVYLTGGNTETQKMITGKVQGFTKEGFLELETESGIRTFTTGDIISVR